MQWDGAEYRYADGHWEKSTHAMELAETRSGNSVTGSNGAWWLRSQYGAYGTPDNASFNEGRRGEVSYGQNASVYLGIVPCFSL